MFSMTLWVSYASLLLYSNILQTTASPSTGNTDSEGGKAASSNSVPVFKKGSTGAIYVPGHSVAVPDKCPHSGEFMDLMILVVSARFNFDKRTAIRQTWGHFALHNNVGMVFVIGDSRVDESEKKLTEEQNEFGDIVRSNNIDTYDNLTLKVLSMLEWVDTYCSKVQFVFKSDDDVYVNVPKLLSFIKQHKNEENAIYGIILSDKVPVRDPRSKWFVTKDEYNSDIYPDYCLGSSYLITRDVVHNLYVTALEETYLKIEDLFVTGIVASKLGVRRVHSEEFNFFEDPDDQCEFKEMISMSEVTFSKQFQLWGKLQSREIKCLL